MNENSYMRNSEGPRLYVEAKARTPGTAGPRFEFKIDVNPCSRGYIVSVTRLTPPNTKVKVLYGKKKNEKEIECAVLELKEKLSKGNV